MRRSGLTDPLDGRSDPRRWAVLLGGGALAALVSVYPRLALETAIFVAENLLLLLPLLAAAGALSAFIRASGLDGRIARLFRGRPVTMIFAASLFGALTPVCGLGVLPLIAGLLAAGTPLAPIMAFWLSSPVTDPSMLLVTAGMLGATFAAAKTAAAFAIGLAGGLATQALLGRGAFRAPLRAGAVKAATCGSSGFGGGPGGGFGGGFGGGPGGGDVVWRFWRDAARRRLFREETRAAALLIFKWLTIAFAAESLLRRALPPEAIAGFVGADSGFAIPLAVLVGTPVYLDGYAALPLVRGLMDLGMAPGAALAFLVSGGITSAYASVAVFSLLRPVLFVWYLALAVAGAALAGYGFEAYLALI